MYEIVNKKYYQEFFGTLSAFIKSSTFLPVYSTTRRILAPFKYCSNQSTPTKDNVCNSPLLVCITYCLYAKIMKGADFTVLFCFVYTKCALKQAIVLRTSKSTFTQINRKTTLNHRHSFLIITKYKLVYSFKPNTNNVLKKKKNPYIYIYILCIFPRIG